MDEAVERQIQEAIEHIESDLKALKEALEAAGKLDASHIIWSQQLADDADDLKDLVWNNSEHRKELVKKYGERNI